MIIIIIVTVWETDDSRIPTSVYNIITTTKTMVLLRLVGIPVVCVGIKYNIVL